MSSVNHTGSVDFSEKRVSRPARFKPFTPFEVKEHAEAFAEYLAGDVGIKAEIVWIQGSMNRDSLAGATSFWDLKVSYKDVFKVKLLYRIKEKYKINDIPQLAKSEKKSIIRDYLLGEAQLKGGWREPMCLLSQIEWYSKISGLPVKSTKKAVADGKHAYYKLHATEREHGHKIAAVMILIGALILATWDRWHFAPIYGFIFTGFGVAFLVFALTRRKRPKWKKRHRLSV